LGAASSSCSSASPPTRCWRALPSPTSPATSPSSTRRSG